MVWFSTYLLYLAEVVTLVVGILFVFIIMVSTLKSGAGDRLPGSKIKLVKLNKRYDEQASHIVAATRSKKENKRYHKALAKARKAEGKQKDKAEQKKAFVVRFKGDMMASSTDILASMVNAVLLAACPGDEVVVILESAGGVVHGYGLAASQLDRMRSAQLQLTVVVDKVAASGGYMMACVAHKIIAAPFAIIGSVGVVFQIPNFNKMLKKHNVDFEMITAGDYKRTLTMFGENTAKGKEKVVEEIADTHELFKSFIMNYRPSLNMSEVATGEHWFGEKAKSLGLVDEIATSDEYLLKLHQGSHCQMYELVHVHKPSVLSRALGKAALYFNYRFF